MVSTADLRVGYHQSDSGTKKIACIQSSPMHGSQAVIVDIEKAIHIRPSQASWVNGCLLYAELPV